jgi:hypothetical protein
MSPTSYVSPHTTADIAAGESQALYGQQHADSTKTLAAHTCRRIDCPTCGVQLLKQRAPKIAKRIKAVAERMKSPIMLTVFSNSADPQQRAEIAERMLSEAAKLKASLQRKKLIGSDFVAVVEFTRAGFPHLHVILDSKSNEEQLREAIQSWNSDSRRAATRLSVWTESVDLTACSAAWAASYLSKQWRHAEQHPLPPGIKSSIRRFTTSRAPAAGKANRRRRRHKKHAKPIRSMTIEELKQLCRLKCRASKARRLRQLVSPNAINRKPATSCSTNSQVAVIEVWDHCNRFVRESSPIQIRFVAAAFLTGNGPEIIRDPFAARLQLSANSLATLENTIRSAGLSKVGRIIEASDVLNPLQQTLARYVESQRDQRQPCF